MKHSTFVCLLQKEHGDILMRDDSMGVAAALFGRLGLRRTVGLSYLARPMFSSMGRSIVFEYKSKERWECGYGRCAACRHGDASSKEAVKKVVAAA